MLDLFKHTSQLFFFQFFLSLYSWGWCNLKLISLSLYRVSTVIIEACQIINHSICLINHLKNISPFRTTCIKQELIVSLLIELPERCSLNLITDFVCFLILSLTYSNLYLAFVHFLLRYCALLISCNLGIGGLLRSNNFGSLNLIPLCKFFVFVSFNLDVSCNGWSFIFLHSFDFSLVFLVFDPVVTI